MKARLSIDVLPATARHLILEVDEVRASGEFDRCLGVILDFESGHCWIVLRAKIRDPFAMHVWVNREIHLGDKKRRDQIVQHVRELKLAA